MTSTMFSPAVYLIYNRGHVLYMRRESVMMRDHLLPLLKPSNQQRRPFPGKHCQPQSALCRFGLKSSTVNETVCLDRVHERAEIFLRSVTSTGTSLHASTFSIAVAALWICWPTSIASLSRALAKSC